MVENRKDSTILSLEHGDVNLEFSTVESNKYLSKGV